MPSIHTSVCAAADELRRDRKKKTKNDATVRLASLVHKEGREGVEAEWERSDGFHEAWKLKVRRMHLAWASVHGCVALVASPSHAPQATGCVWNAGHVCAKSWSGRCRRLGSTVCGHGPGRSPALTMRARDMLARTEWRDTS